MDKSIMNALEENEDLWYTLVIDRYAPYVTAIVSGLAKGALTTSDVEEVAADVFYKVWTKRTQIQEVTMKAFIAQIARNTCIDRLRKAHKEIVPYDDDILHITYHEYPEEIAIAQEQKQIIQRAVESFGELDREIFIRFYYFGETIKSISKKLNLNQSTIKTKLHRSRGKLRSIVQERGYDCE